MKNLLEKFSHCKTCIKAHLCLPYSFFSILSVLPCGRIIIMITAIRDTTEPIKLGPAELKSKAKPDTKGANILATDITL